MPTTESLLADLARAFPRQSVTAGTFQTYLRELADVPVPTLERTVRTLIRSSEFWPSVRAVLEACAELTLALPGEADALAQIEARMAWARQDAQSRAQEPPPVHPLVREALDHVGGWHAFRAADEPAVVRGQFGRLFRELRARAVRDAQVGDLAALPSPAGPRELSP